MVYHKTSVHLNGAPNTDVGAVSSCEPATVVDHVDVSGWIPKLGIQFLDAGNASCLAIISRRLAGLNHSVHVALIALVVQAVMQDVLRSEKSDGAVTPFPML